MLKCHYSSLCSSTRHCWGRTNSDNTCQILPTTLFIHSVDCQYVQLSLYSYIFASLWIKMNQLKQSVGRKLEPWKYNVDLSAAALSSDAFSAATFYQKNWVFFLTPPHSLKLIFSVPVPTSEGRGPKLLAPPPGPHPGGKGSNCLLLLLICGDPSCTGTGRRSNPVSW